MSKSLDRISTLPSGIIQNILMFLSIREAGRTSVLSKAWRHRWEDVQQLVIDREFAGSSSEEVLMRNISQVLLLHSGPIHKFCLSDVFLESSPQLNQLIYSLSWRGIQDIILQFPRLKHGQKSPSSLFSCLELRSLALQWCPFNPPPEFQGFSRLTHLKLFSVTLPNSFESFISSCPLLEQLKLKRCQSLYGFAVSAPNLKSLCIDSKSNDHMIGLENTPSLAVLHLRGVSVQENFKDTNLICILNRLPAIQIVSVDEQFLESVAPCDFSTRQPRICNYLKFVKLLHVPFYDPQVMSSVVYWIKSSPILQKLVVKVANDDDDYNDANEEAVVQHLEAQVQQEFSIDRLEVVKLISFNGFRAEVEFVKLLLVKSPALKALHIEPCYISVEESFKILKEIVRLRRASPRAEIFWMD